MFKNTTQNLWCLVSLCGLLGHPSHQSLATTIDIIIATEVVAVIAVVAFEVTV